ncbi:MAG: carboxyl transferase domain-containing protein [Ktedonobacteraceae bacterium]
MHAHERLRSLADPDTFRPIRNNIWPVDVLGFVDERPYTARLADAQRRTGLHDALIAGRCRIGGVDTVLVIMDFGFLGGSMGSVVGERVASAFEYATRHRLPVVTVATSGGARMQEGIVSLMQMAKTASAVQRFHAAGLFYLSILTNPTTGGVFASFASLGDVIVAEPKALVGFAGPRVVEQITGKNLPPDSHSAEFLLKHGHLDAVVSRQDLPQYAGRWLHLVTRQAQQRLPLHPYTKQLTLSAESQASPWETVQLARHPDRPTASDYIRQCAADFMELRGDRIYGDDASIMTGIGTIEGHPVVFVGQERSHVLEQAETDDIVQEPAAQGSARAREMQAKPRPQGYRKALRAMNLAKRLHYSLVTLVDTMGADPGLESEQLGLASSIAHCLATMSDLSVPIVAAIIGEGGSGGALALGVADRVLMLQNATYEVISPEGAAAILYHDGQRAEQVASSLKLTAADCLQLGVIDSIVPEPVGGAHTDPETAIQALKLCIMQALGELTHQAPDIQLARRYQKFRRIGQYEKRLLPSIPAALRAQMFAFDFSSLGSRIRPKAKNAKSLMAL